METSDSECFESADEDIAYEEAVEKAPAVKPNIKDENRKESNEENSKIDQKGAVETDRILVCKSAPNENKIPPSLDTCDAKNLETKSSKKLTKTRGKLGTKLVAGPTLDIDKINVVGIEKGDKEVTEVKRISEQVGKNEAEMKEHMSRTSNFSDNSARISECPIPPSNDIVETSNAGEKNQQEENMWENEEWETFDDIQPSSQTSKSQTQSTQSTKQNTGSHEETSNFGWSSWGWSVPSVISTATQSVASLTSTVSQGLNSVFEGIPDPEEMARLTIEEKQQLKQHQSAVENENLDERIKEKESGNEQASILNFRIDGLVSGVTQLTKFVENTGTKVITGGLDTLETIGKKTFEVLQEGDPGLKKKRAFLKLNEDKPVLSQLLREAREKHEQECQREDRPVRKKNYETLFDDYQGLVHLEALELLSKQCEIKLCTLMETTSGDALIDIQETVDQVRELCELPDEEDGASTDIGELKEKITSAVAELGLSISYEKLLNSWSEMEAGMEKKELHNEKELHQQAIENLAQLTAMAVENFHKVGELLLVKERRSTADEADSLVQITTSVTSLVSIIATKFSENLNSRGEKSLSKEEINGLITNVFFEAANSSSYIQDAFQLLIPVLQVGAV